jgi:hypothetical protein
LLPAVPSVPRPSRTRLLLVLIPLLLLVVAGIGLALFFLLRPSAPATIPLARYMPPKGAMTASFELPIGDGAEKWAPLLDLLRDIPGFREAERSLARPFPEVDIDLKRDIEPWLGRTGALSFPDLASLFETVTDTLVPSTPLPADLASLEPIFSETSPQSPEASTPPILLALEVRDPGAFRAFLERLRRELAEAHIRMEEDRYGSNTVFALPGRDLYFSLRDEQVLLLSNARATLEEALDREERDSLAGDPTYRTLLRRLPADGVAYGYLSTQDILPEAAGPQQVLLADLGPQAMAYAVVIEPEGLRLVYALSMDLKALDEAGLGDMYRDAQTANSERAFYLLPRKSLLVFSSRNLLHLWEAVLQTLQRTDPRAYRELRGNLQQMALAGLDLESLLSQMEGEYALFLNLDREEGIPVGGDLFLHFGLVVEVGDADQVRQSMRRLETLLALGGGGSFSEMEIGGITARVLQGPQVEGLTPGYAFVDDFLVIASDEPAIRLVAQARRQAGERLAASEAFRSTLEGLPGSRSTLLFLDLASLLETLSASIPPRQWAEAGPGLRLLLRLDGLGLALGAGRPGDEVFTFTLFLHWTR